MPSVHVAVFILVVIILIGTFLFLFNYTGYVTHLGGRPNALIVYPFFDFNGPYTFISIINLGSTNQTVKITFRDKTGAALANTSNIVQPNNMWNLVSGSSGGPEGTRGEEGYIIVKAEDVYSLRVTAYTFFPATMASFPLSVSSTSISPYESLNVPTSTLTYSPVATSQAVSSADTTPPDTTIVTTPPTTTTATSFSFYFRSTETGSTFECSLDGGVFESCSSPKRYTSLTRTAHTFSVRAKDTTGNVDPTPASFTWTIR